MQVAQGLVHMSFEYLQGCQFHNLPEQHISVIECSHGEEFFPYIYSEFPL